MWINGKTLSKQVAVWPEVGVMQFGTENTGCQQFIDYDRTCSFLHNYVTTSKQLEHISFFHSFARYTYSHLTSFLHATVYQNLHSTHILLLCGKHHVVGVA